MLVKDVLIKYHKMVPFPWTLKKIKKAGYNPTQLLVDLGRQLGNCEDIDTPTGKQTLELIKELDLTG